MTYSLEPPKVGNEVPISILRRVTIREFVDLIYTLEQACIRLITLV